MAICFYKVASKHIDIIFSWLAKPYIKEFWDNSQEHKDDIINFAQPGKDRSNYFNGAFTYWVASHEHNYFALRTGLTHVKL